MSAAGSRLAQVPFTSTLPHGRSPLAHLLHALNQPLTGLQCSLELAVSGPHSTEHYVRTLREGLELTGRMRVLVAALRELVDAPPSRRGKIEPFVLDGLLRTTLDELDPVAKENGVRLQVATGVALPVQTDREGLSSVLFRCLESALSLTARNTDLRVEARAEQGSACITLSWTQNKLPDYSPFSPQELGLLIAQAGWQQAGGEWTTERAGNRQTCMLRMPLLEQWQTSESAQLGGLQ